MTAEQRGNERVTTETPEDEESEESTDAADEADDGYDAHLSDVPAGSGCTEIWEHLSEEREDDD